MPYAIPLPRASVLRPVLATLLVLLTATPVWAATSARPETDVRTPEAKSTVDPDVSIAGVATDDSAVSQVRVSVRDISTGSWLHEDGGWRSSFAYRLADLGAGSTTRDFVLSLELAPGEYGLSVRAVDDDGLSDSSPAWVPFEVTEPVLAVSGSPTTDVSTPTHGADLEQPATITGTAGAPEGVAGVTVALRDVDSKQWLQTDGTWSTTFVRHDADLASPDALVTDWSMATDLPAGNYGMSVRSVDATGSTDPAPEWVAFSVPEVDYRDPTLWPYPSDSIWNLPRGDDADLRPFGLEAPTGKTLNIEEEILFTSHDLPASQWRPIQEHDAAWSNRSRCGSRTGDVLKRSMFGQRTFPIPGGFDTVDFHGNRPNHSAAILLPDLTLAETQPLHVCGDGTVVSQYASSRWQGDSIVTGGHGASSDGRSGGGSHGGSGMTAFGGTIRLGEWVSGGTIPHATKIEVDARKYLSMWADNAGRKLAAEGHVWPALRADAFWTDSKRGYGSIAGTTPPAYARMGALLSLPSSFDVEARLTTEPARILARSIRDYGTYIVDTTQWDTVQFATEWSPAGRVSDEFEQEWGFSIDGKRGKWGNDPAQDAFLADMERIYEAMHVVVDNQPGQVGGRGDRMAELAPPIDPAFVEQAG